MRIPQHTQHTPNIPQHTPTYPQHTPTYLQHTPNIPQHTPNIPPQDPSRGPKMPPEGPPRDLQTQTPTSPPSFPILRAVHSPSELSSCARCIQHSRRAVASAIATSSCSRRLCSLSSCSENPTLQDDKGACHHHSTCPRTSLLRSLRAQLRSIPALFHEPKHLRTLQNL